MSRKITKLIRKDKEDKEEYAVLARFLPLCLFLLKPNF
jgi:hypothetical protein